MRFPPILTRPTFLYQSRLEILRIGSTHVGECTVHAPWFACWESFSFAFSQHTWAPVPIEKVALSLNSRHFFVSSYTLSPYQMEGRLASPGNKTGIAALRLLAVSVEYLDRRRQPT